MSPLPSQRRRRLLAAGVAAAAGTAFGAALLAQPAEKVIRIAAKKFAYTPNEITLQKGVPVVLELTTEDVVMGFSAPDFKLDAVIVPGKAVQLRLTPDKSGTFQFICNVFCGDGHENMDGQIHVT